ncbi:amidohydrolase family protein [Marinimicrobium sp. ARAG 43.8]|uniref:amidohydrolase family protein n=1 Tax=Marinimicrobium sp. ARAG 43.8 TaxID=3418719 RepID=UPI003CF978E9
MRKKPVPRALSVSTALKGVILGAFLANPLSVMADQHFYTSDDFKRLDKIDSHVHANSIGSDMVDLAREANFKLISINVDYPDFPPVDRQLEITAELYQRHPEDFAFAGTFTMQDWGTQQWVERKVEQIDHATDEGAIAIKVWKNIGMSFRDESGELVMVNDEGFTPVFDYLEEQDLPLIGHQGEPRNCWLPVSEMTVLNDKQYFKEHPHYHMYLHPEMPSYEDQMNSRDRMLDMHPKLTFIGAHMASLEWSVEALARFLEDNPSAVVDMAARIGQIQYQSMQDYEEVRQFFIKYQDRILYATDLTYTDGQSGQEFLAEAMTVWQSDWDYLATDNTLTSGFVEGEFKGLHLPKTVIDKIYRSNAERVFKTTLYASKNH